MPVANRSSLWVSLANSLKRWSIAALHKRLASADPLLKGDLKVGKRVTLVSCLGDEAKFSWRFFEPKLQQLESQTHPISFLLFHGLSLQSVHYLDGAVSFAPVDRLGDLGGLRATGGHLRHEADVRPHHAIVHGQLGGDALHTLEHRDIHSADVTAATVSCRGWDHPSSKGKKNTHAH